jgi:hypothetical protein
MSVAFNGPKAAYRGLPRRTRLAPHEVVSLAFLLDYRMVSQVGQCSALASKNPRSQLLGLLRKYAFERELDVRQIQRLQLVDRGARILRLVLHTELINLRGALAVVANNADPGSAISKLSCWRMGVQDQGRFGHERNGVVSGLAGQWRAMGSTLLNAKDDARPACSVSPGLDVDQVAGLAILVLRPRILGRFRVVVGLRLGRLARVELVENL